MTLTKTSTSEPAQRAGSAPSRPSSTTASSFRSLLLRVIARPEATALVGVIVVFVYFAATAADNGFLSRTGTENYLVVAAQIGIITRAVTLLMIAGEFDVSVGSMTGAGGIAVAYPVVYHHWPLWLALGLGLGVACLVGLIQGLLTVKTGLPSFIVTLAGLYVISGLNLEITKSLTSTTQVDGINQAAQGDALRPLFDGRVFGLPVEVAWWIGLTCAATILLTRTRFGNWIYACGGDKESARRSGVPVTRVKVSLFIGTAVAATLVGVLTMFTVDSANINTGSGFEFQTITAAVIGGTLLTGGFGSAIGAALGALVYGMINQGFFFTNIEGNWVTVFLGVMLLLAVGVNHYARSVSLRRRGG